MRVYALISQKGGAGKSTLAVNLAALAGEDGPALVIDRDPQKTTEKWWTRRAAQGQATERPELVDLQGQPLASAVAAARGRPGALFIDTPGRAAEPEAEAARVADLIIVPVRPTMKDLDAVVDTLTMLKRLDRPRVLVVNAARNERRARDAKAALSRYGVPVCPDYLTDRTAYHDADLEGRTVMELRGGAGDSATSEMRRVWAWIKETEK